MCIYVCFCLCGDNIVPEYVKKKKTRVASPHPVLSVTDTFFFPSIDHIKNIVVFAT